MTNLMLNNLSTIILILFIFSFLYTSFRQKVQNFEIVIISFGLVFAYLYRVVRVTSSESFIWIIIFPIIAFLYLILKGARGKISDLNSIDILMTIFLIYGLLTTFLNIVIKQNIFLSFTKFSHFYLPIFFYFLTRIYLSRNKININLIIKVIYFLSGIIILETLIEYYFIVIIGNPDAIAWNSKFILSIADNYNKPLDELYSDPKINFLTIGIFGHIKVISMAIASLSFFYWGVVFAKIKNKPNGQARIIYDKFKFVNYFFIISSLSLIILSRNTSVIITFFVIVLILLSFNISLRSFLITSLIIIFLFYFFGNLLLIQYEIKFKPDIYGYSALNTIFDLNTLFYEYKINFFNSILGNYVLTNSTMRGGSLTELRLLMYPVYYGWLWTLVVLTIMTKLILYSRYIILKSFDRNYSIIGYGLLGYFLFVILDIHYPSFDRHGPYETFFIMAALAVNIRNYILINNVTK